MIVLENIRNLVVEAWNEYNRDITIVSITDISAKVSTNHVYRLGLSNQTYVITKISYFGRYTHFVEDHTIINNLANNLPEPFDNILAHSLTKKNQVYTFKGSINSVDVWIVFYRPIRIDQKLPNVLSTKQIQQLAKEFARFHQACTEIRNTLPTSSKTMYSDVKELIEESNRYHEDDRLQINHHANQFLTYHDNLDLSNIPIIPVFVDWNIGNFSVSQSLKIFSRWDYDWFRMSSRMIDFYFFARIVSSAGDKTIFTYNIEVLSEDRFISFLKFYHQEFPLTSIEVEMLPEMYRFFLLNYVVKYGDYFFNTNYSQKLFQEVIHTHLDSISSFDASKIKSALGL